jgi:hypothetical protein
MERCSSQPLGITYRLRTGGLDERAKKSQKILLLRDLFSTFRYQYQMSHRNDPKVVRCLQAKLIYNNQRHESLLGHGSAGWMVDHEKQKNYHFWYLSVLNIKIGLPFFKAYECSYHFRFDRAHSWREPLCGWLVRDSEEPPVTSVSSPI